ncbi:MAG: phosphoribosylglycinamide formyltransferase 2, partial [Alloprevotella sp.]
KPTTRLNRRMGVVLVSGELQESLEDIRSKAKRLAAKVEVY